MRFGDQILLKNKATNGVLVFDQGDRITSHDEAYSCTTSGKDIGPCARSVLVINKVEDDGAPDNVLRYGQKVRFESTNLFIGKKTYLHSCQISPLAFARFSRNQEVCMVTKSIYNTVWKIVHVNPNLRVSSIGEPVTAHDEIVIEHCATAQFLSSDKIKYMNEFGLEYEVSVFSQTTNNKSQALNLEKVGRLTVDQPTKLQAESNTWAICTAVDPSLAEPIQEVKYTVDDLIREVKDKLKAKGSLGIRGIARAFKLLDNNGNGKIDQTEFYWGLKDIGISLNEEEAASVLKNFDRDGNGFVSFDEFLRALRGDLNASRLSWIKKAYKKLDINGDGTVKLDDIAQLFDVSKHQDIVHGRKDPKQVYLEFMSLWETQKADGIVSMEEFLDYFADVSASIDSDEYFAVMMQNAWKLQ